MILVVRFWLVVSLLLSALSVASWAATTSVQQYFHELRALRADFVQQVYDEQGRLIRRSSGRMLMQQPGKFRWDYQKPSPQIVVADGQRLWSYDQDLEQVSVRPLDQALSATPLSLLSGTTPLDASFTIGPARTRDGLSWYELKPKQPQSEFRLLRIAFRGEVLASLELEDGFGQRTRLDLENLERNPSLDPNLLRFTPPAGVDVVGDPGASSS